MSHESMARSGTSPPINLSIAGAGRVVILYPWSIRSVIEAIGKHNSGMKRLAGRLQFPWIVDLKSGEPTWQRLKERQNVSTSELRRLERQLNAILIREKLALSPRYPEVVESFVTSRNQSGSRKVRFLPWNGLALEVRGISAKQLLQKGSAIIATRRINFGGFHVWRFRGIRIRGPMSARILTVTLADFYDATKIWEVTASDFSKRTWFLIEQIGTLDGFRIVDEPLTNQISSTSLPPSGTGLIGNCSKRDW